MTVTVKRTVSMGHRLPSYNGICNSLHGHNVCVEVTVEVMSGFLDFKVLDAALAGVLADFDHAMVLADTDPFVPQLRLWNQRLVLLNVEPTTEALAQTIFNLMAAQYGVTEVTVYETGKYSATATAVDPSIQRSL